VGFPVHSAGGRGPCDEHRHRCWGRTQGMGRDADARVAQVSEPHPDATSRPDVQVLGVSTGGMLTSDC
jgi:hypothetical protein